MKYKNVFALYTSEDVFGLIADSEEELTSWLQLLQEEHVKSEQLPDNGKGHGRSGLFRVFVLLLKILFEVSFAMS